MELENGYKMKTTFWQDFTIAEKFGGEAILDTYERAKEWKNSIEYMTELAIVLNHKIWQWYGKNKDLARSYDQLWRNVDEYIMGDDNRFTDEEIQYYLRVTD